MKLISIDLGSPLPDIPAPSAGEQPVLVRFHRHPLGLLRLSRAHTAAELLDVIVNRFSSALAVHLAEDALRSDPRVEWDPLDLASLPGECPRVLRQELLPPITVAVCTRERSQSLGACLDSLRALEYPGSRLDRLVVDNAPETEGTERLVRKHYPEFRYAREPRPGLNWARNRAVLEARGEIIAFTDDDVRVDEAWARAIATVFVEEPDAMAVTGLVVPDELDVLPQILFERYGGFSRGFQRRYHRIDRDRGEKAAPQYAGTGAFGTGANMAFRRQIFDAVGLFDPALDVGTVTNGGGDLEMFFRVVKEGHLLVYEPSAIARHRHRRRYSDLRRQIANNGVGLYAYLVRSARAYAEERSELMRFGAWWLWWWSGRRLLRSLVVRPEIPRALMVAELAGSLAGLRRYPTARAEALRIERHFGPQESLENADSPLGPTLRSGTATLGSGASAA